ncbi:hypothetical protein [Natronomonas gomsonensis]|uniref:DUF7503 family protein n=1 Tax=Natronomonas gomsonensis TaxID=1046043 RepID=UPI0015BF4EC4|nr:hypothetical protein [Natronomonas gomsonensis]
MSASTTPESESSSIKTFLAEHPRMAGVVFTALLLLSQAGMGAGAGGAYAGP